MTTLTFLGTGWSHGVPVIGCTCTVCTEAHPRNIRRRPSIHLSSDSVSVVVDVGADFRDQALRAGLQHLDAVFLTHAHADHVMGLDDIRRFTWMRETPLRLLAEPRTLDRVRELLPYAAPDLAEGKAVPQVSFTTWSEPVAVGPLTFTPFPVPHGGMPCLGIRIDTPGGSIGYVPDCNDLPAEIRPFLQDLDIMILNALRIRPHPHHLSFERSRALLEEVGATRSYFTHMGCPIDYTTVAPTLPPHLELAYDGLELLL